MNGRTEDGKGGEAEGGEAGDGGQEREEGFGSYGGREVPGGVIGRFEERAMEGMLLALQPRISVMEREWH